MSESKNFFVLQIQPPEKYKLFFLIQRQYQHLCYKPSVAQDALSFGGSLFIGQTELLGAHWSTRNHTMCSSQACTLTIWNRRLIGWAMARPEITYCIRSIMSKIITSVIRFEEECSGILFLAETGLVPGEHEAAISLRTLQNTFRVFHNIPLNLMPLFVALTTCSCAINLDTMSCRDLTCYIFGTYGKFQEKYTYIKTQKSGLV